MSIIRELARLGNKIDSASTGEFLSKGTSTGSFDAIQYTDLTGRPSVLDSALSSQLIDSSYVQLRQTVSGGGLDSALTTQLIDSSYVSARAGSASSGYQVYEYTATQGQTTFQDSDLSGNLLSYTSGGALVFYNGVLMGPDDITATTGSSVVLASGADSGSHVSIAKWSVAGGGGGSSTTNGTGDRGFFWGGVYTAGDYTSQIDYWNITTPGNAADFGDCHDARNRTACTSDGTYAIAAGGNIGGGRTDNMEYVTTATLANATSFGTMSTNVREAAGTSNGTKGLIMGGQWNGTEANTIEYITIATPGNSTDHGDLTSAGAQTCLSAPSNGTYGYFAGGNGSGGDYYPRAAAIDYVAIATTGNASDHGDLTHRKTQQPGAAWDATYALWAGGMNYGTGTSIVEYHTTKIDYITMGTSGNGTDFGDLTVSRHSLAGCTNSTRGTFQGGNPGSSPYLVNTIDYVTIATPGNATDHGDLTRINYETGSTAGAAA